MSSPLSRSVMFVFGGFNSLLLSDVLVYTSASCEAFASRATCAQAWPGILCVWSSTRDACLPWDSAGADQHQPALCNTRLCRCQSFLLVRRAFAAFTDQSRRQVHRQAGCF